MSPEGRASTGAIFRRRRFAARRKRPSLWPVLARGFISALLLVGIPAAAVIWATTSARFRLQEVRIDSTPHIPVAWVESVVAPIAGRNLLLLSLDEVSARLQGHPWIERVELRKEPPDTLEIRLIERTPKALQRRDGELLLIDGQGAVIAPFRPEASWSDLLLVTVIEGAADASAVLAVAADLARIHPAWNQGLSEIEAVGADAYRLYSEVYPFPVVVSGADLRGQIDKLMRWWPRLASRIELPALIDLRFANQMIIKTARRSLNQEG